MEQEHGAIAKKLAPYCGRGNAVKPEFNSIWLTFLRDSRPLSEDEKEAIVAKARSLNA